MARDHEHKFTKLDVGPPKKYRCSVPGCKAEADVDPKTSGPKTDEPAKAEVGRRAE